jgi:hypothetical protein
VTTPALQLDPGNDTPPPEALPRAISHGADTVLGNVAHAIQHAQAVQRSPDAASRAFNFRHLSDHITALSKALRGLAADLASYDPEFAREMARLESATSLDGRSAGPVPPPEDEVPAASQPTTTAHLARSALDHIGHAAVHVAKAAGAASAKQRDFDLRHCLDHLAGGGLSHVRKLTAALNAYYPEVSAEMSALAELASPAGRAPVDAGRSAVPALMSFRCACGEPVAPGGTCAECAPEGRSEAYLRGVAETRQRWSPGPQHEDGGRDDDGGWRAAVYADDSARRY